MLRALTRYIIQPHPLSIGDRVTVPWDSRPYIVAGPEVDGEILLQRGTVLEAVDIDCVRLID
jgi:hypothetical protein